MTDAPTYVHDEAAALRIRIRALGPDAVAEIARGAHVPQAQVRLFRNGLTTLDPKAIVALAGAVSAIETARANGGDNVVQFPAAKTRTKNGKAKTAPRAPDDGKALKTAGGTPEGGAGKAPGAGGFADAAGEAPGAPGAEERGAAGEAPGADEGAQDAGGIDAIRARAAALEKDDVEGARAIIEAAVILPRMDTLEKDRLLGAIKKALGVGVKKSSLEDIWSHAAERLRPSPEAMAAAVAAVKAADKEAERARLWPLVEKLANRRDLLDHATDTAQALGVVGERKSIKANYIVMSSRVLAEPRVISVVITGLSSAGKSHLMNTAARLFPTEYVVVITTGSPKALIYLVAEDIRALAHKIIVLHETAGFIAASDTEDNPSATLARELLTGGRIRHLVVERDDNGRFVTREIEVEGPISLITTSARANLDPEMENRLLEVPMDESPRATRDIQMAQLSGKTSRTAEAAAAAVEELIEFQRWLQLEAGARVVIPDELLEAIAAVGGLPLTVQTRRDVPLFLLAIKACAAIHIARRQRDAAGRVIAEFEDYDAAHDAIDGFLAAAYSTSLKPPEIAVLAAIEALIVENQERRKAEAARAAAGGKPETAGLDGFSITDMKAQFTYDTLAARAQIKSRKTLSKRIKALKRAKAIEVTIEHSGYGTKVSTWELLIPAAHAVTAAKYGRFMPDPLNVSELLNDSVTRRKRLDQILAENGTLPDWRGDDAKGDDVRSSNRDADGADDDDDDDGEETV